MEYKIKGHDPHGMPTTSRRVFIPRGQIEAIEERPIDRDTMIFVGSNKCFITCDDYDTVRARFLNDGF